MPRAALTLLFDGQCPFCRREVEWLRKHDRRQQLELVDIADPGFEAAAYGLDRDAVHAELHAVTADGRVLRRVRAVQAAYRAIGRGWLVAPLTWPGVHLVVDRLYGLFARHRVRWGNLLGRGCQAESCRVPPSPPPSRPPAGEGGLHGRSTQGVLREAGPPPETGGRADPSG